MERRVKSYVKNGKTFTQGLHKVFIMAVKGISQKLTALGESGSEVSHFIPDPRNFSEVTKLSENI